MTPRMGEPTTAGFSLTPDEERFFVRFLRRRALPLAAAVSALAGGLSAALLSCALAPTAATPSPAFPEGDALAEAWRPVADEQARAELAALREQLAVLREKAARTPASQAAPRDPGEVGELRRAIDSLRRELQILATSVSALETRPPGSVPASLDDAASVEIDPLRKRVYSIETRQDREEASRLEWAGNVEQRVRNLELARKAREAEQQASVQAILERLHQLEASQNR